MKRIGVILLVAGIAGCAGNPTTLTNTQPGASSIAGLIQYPGVPIPAMRVCAHKIPTRAMACVNTELGQKQYRIKHLSAGDYQVIAGFQQADLRVGGHMQQVQCIRAPCPDLLITVSLKARQARTDIHLNEFYGSRADFPALPTGNK